MQLVKLALGGLVLMLAGLSPSLAHVADIAHQHSFAQGVVHPLTGLDHLLAMLTLGLWAGGAGGHARWVWPATFVGIAGLGALFAQAGYSLPAQEPLIAATVLLLGGFVYLGLQMPLFAGMLMTSGMAYVHGYAHGTEIPADAPVPGFILGFLLATALLHGAGLVIAPRFNGVTRRMAGGLIAGCGSVLLALAF